MAFTAMIMTADREEVVDFVAPYFEQSGISIGNRKLLLITNLKNLLLQLLENQYEKHLYLNLWLSWNWKFG